MSVVLLRHPLVLVHWGGPSQFSVDELLGNMVGVASIKCVLLIQRNNGVTVGIHDLLELLVARNGLQRARKLRVVRLGL